jgi:hypothetical protein
MFSTSAITPFVEVRFEQPSKILYIMLQWLSAGQQYIESAPRGFRKIKGSPDN